MIELVSQLSSHPEIAIVQVRQVSLRSLFITQPAFPLLTQRSDHAVEDEVSKKKRLAKVADLTGQEQLDALRTPYEPAPRELPSDEELRVFLDAVRDHPRWGWATAALAVYGCRPAEVFSLCPAEDGTGRVLTVKRKGKQPIWRTALALPQAWSSKFDLANIQRPWECGKPGSYDSLTAKKLVEQWGRWLRRNREDLQLYDLRHAWAVRSIRLNLNASLAAKCLGHSVSVHHETYHRWLEGADVAALAVRLRSF